MKRIISLFTLGVLFFAQGAFSFEESHLELSKSHKVFYKYQKAKPGQPTVVLLNGLIYAIENWNDYFNQLTDKGLGVLQVAYSTQPESLRLLNENPYFVKTVLTPMGPKQAGTETQVLVDEVMAVVNHLGVSKFHLVSLSYGSIVASRLAVQERGRIHSLILMAPAVLPSHRYQAYGESRHQLYIYQKKTNQLPSYDPDYYYDLEMYQSMFSIISPQAFKYQFERVPFMTFFHGVFQMARSSKWFDLKDFASSNLPPTHLFLASREEVSLFEDQKRFWRLLADNPARRSRVLFQGGEHALPGVAPAITARITLKVLRGQLSSGEHKVEIGSGESVGSSSTGF